MKVNSILLFFTLTISLSAANLTTTAGKIYKNYEIDNATPAGLAIFHDGGAVTVPYEELPPEIRAKYKTEEENFRRQQKELMEKRRKAQLEYQKKQKEYAARLQKQKEEQERQVAEERKQQEEQKRYFTEIIGIAGYKLGDILSEDDIIKKYKDNIYKVKIKQPFMGMKQCSVKLTPDKRIYEIVLNCPNVFNKDIDSAINYFKEQCPQAFPRIPKKDPIWAYKNGSKQIELLFLRPFPDMEKNNGVTQFTFFDTELMPAEEFLYKAVSKKYDEMQKVTWLSSLYEIEYKEDNNTFELNPYIGKFDDGGLTLRIKTRYTSERGDYRDSRWIFYNKIQFMADGNKEVWIKTEHPAKKSEVENYGVTEWADILLDDDFLKLRNAKRIKVKFYGKYSHEFDLTPVQCIIMNDVLSLYQYLKDQKSK